MKLTVDVIVVKVLVLKMNVIHLKLNVKYVWNAREFRALSHNQKAITLRTEFWRSVKKWKTQLESELDEKFLVPSMCEKRKTSVE